MPRRNVSAIIDVNESVKQLETELRILTTRKAGLETNVKDLTAKRDGLDTEISNLAEKIEKQVKAAETKSGEMIEFAQDKVNKANAREAESVQKQEELKDHLKAASDLIKSNEGMKNNLAIQEVEGKIKIQKIKDLLLMISEAIKNI